MRSPVRGKPIPGWSTNTRRGLPGSTDADGAAEREGIAQSWRTHRERVGSLHRLGEMWMLEEAAARSGAGDVFWGKGTFWGRDSNQQ